MKHNLRIQAIQALQDNYIWCIIHQNQCVVVDPGEAEPVLRWLASHHYELHAILVTHHHLDHTGGIDALVAKHPCEIYGPESFPKTTQHCIEGTHIDFWQGVFTLDVMSTPGHTMDHIVFYNQDLIF